MLDSILNRFGTMLYIQVVGIPMGTNSAPLVNDLLLFCHERDLVCTTTIEPPPQYGQQPKPTGEGGGGVT